MTSPFTEMVKDKHLIVCCGSGGVGKTTVSAAIGVQAAQMGKRTLVLTIDPAKRLAGALGLETLTPRPQLINLRRSVTGSLHAAQLDAKHTFDGIIERFAPDQETQKTILKNPLYKHLSSMIAGSQEYMAMEKLYELSREEFWDLLVLDTPPARNAMDFLDAPQRMVRAITDSFLKYFIRPSVYAGRLGNRALNVLSTRFEKTLGRLTGVQFIHEMFDLVSATVSLLDGFRDRAASTEEILKKDTTTFLLITSPRPAAIADANKFFQRFQKYQLPLGGCIINRVHPSFAKDNETLKGIRNRAIKKGERLALALVENAIRYQRLNEVDQYEIDLLRGLIPVCRTIPLFPQDVCDINGLEKINEYLFEL